MRFHNPSFLSHLFDRLEQEAGEKISYMAHRHTVYVYADFPLSRPWLVEQVIFSVIASYETPLWTPDKTEQETLIKGLLLPHEKALRRELQKSTLYIKSYRGERGREGRGSSYEYHIDLSAIRNLCIETIAETDKELFRRELYFEESASVRQIQKLMLVKHGKLYSKERARKVLNVLEDEGFLSRNGNLRMSGRDVVRA